MSSKALQNSQVVTSIISAMSSGDGKTFLGLMADDFHFQMMGQTPLSVPCHSKSEFITFLKDLAEHLDGGIALTITNLFATDDYVLSECDGQATLKNGQAYNNKYAQVWKIKDGLVVELREYNDTQLVMDKFFSN